MVLDLPRELPRLADGELVERAQQGEVDAYEEIVRRYQEMAFRLAYVVCSSREDAEEAAQDAFLKAHRALDRFRSGAPLRPWLLRIVANEARNRRVSRGRRVGLELRLAGEPAPDDAAASAQARVLAAVERQSLLEGLARLPERHREVVLCRLVLGLSEAESAAAIGCRRGTVKSRLSRALARLRAELDEGALGA